MSVYMEFCSGIFTIKKENIPGAFEAAKKLVKSGEYAAHWDDKWHINLKNSDDFIKFLEVAGWEVGVDDKNNLTELTAGEYYNNEDFTLFKAIAPFVEADCYLDIETSDFQKFEWYFDGYTCIRKEGTVDYDCNIEIVEALLKERKDLPTMLGIHPELDKRIHEVLKDTPSKLNKKFFVVAVEEKMDSYTMLPFKHDFLEEARTARDEEDCPEGLTILKVQVIE